MVAGVGFILIVAILQGVFLLPMSRARQWSWEHMWLDFFLDRNAALQLGTDVPGVTESSGDFRPSSAE